MITKKQRMFENIYDILAGTDFKAEAMQEWENFRGLKESEWNPADDTIKIGKRFTIKLIKQ